MTKSWLKFKCSIHISKPSSLATSCRVTPFSTFKSLTWSGYLLENRLGVIYSGEEESTGAIPSNPNSEQRYGHLSAKLRGCVSSAILYRLELPAESGWRQRWILNRANVSWPASLERTSHEAGGKGNRTCFDWASGWPLSCINLYKDRNPINRPGRLCGLLFGTYPFWIYC